MPRTVIPNLPAAKHLFWLKHVRAWRASGLPQNRYALSKGLHPRTLFDWCRKFPVEPPASPGGDYLPDKAPRKSPAMSVASAAQFVQIPVQLLATAVGRQKQPTKLSIILGKRFRIVVRDDFSPALLEKVVETLEGIR